MDCCSHFKKNFGDWGFILLHLGEGSMKSWSNSYSNTCSWYIVLLKPDNDEKIIMIKSNENKDVTCL